MLGSKDIKTAQKQLKKLDGRINEQSELHDLCSDPTRLRMFFLFKNNENLCPSDVSEILGLSMSAVSHQLRVLEMSGLLGKVKMGKMICYSLNKKGQKFLKEWHIF